MAEVSTSKARPGRLDFASERNLPILMAASGPKAIELAGEVADGVLLLVGFTPEIIQAATECLDRGAKRSGRRVEDLDVIWAVRTATANTIERPIDKPTNRCALVAF